MSQCHFDTDIDLSVRMCHERLFDNLVSLNLKKKNKTLGSLGIVFYEEEPFHLLLFFPVFAF